MKIQIIPLVLSLCLSTLSSAKVEVLFHPYDETLVKAADWIRQAQSSVNMIMYNIDSTDQSPVFKMLQEPEMQSRIRSGNLKIRLILEGSGDAAGAEKKMLAFESLGVDARYIEASLSLHHKFAVIDQGLPTSKVISGSANWSLTSYKNYSENILFIDQELSIGVQFAEEFARWWTIAKDFGQTFAPELEAVQPQLPSADLEAHFNSKNFNGTRVIDRSAYLLTREIVAEIDQAQTEIQIATTRIKLRPVYDALIRAAQRGVVISIVVSMDEYEWPFIRQTAPVICEDIWAANCSQGKNYSDLLSLASSQGLPISLRVKFYNLKTGLFITNQMHSKYILIDRQKILSGSFNWSYASEYSNVENIIEINGLVFPEAMAQYQKDFASLQDLGRSNYSLVKEKIYEAFHSGEKMNCRLDPMVLTMPEIDALVLVQLQDGTFKKTEVICQ